MCDVEIGCLQIGGNYISWCTQMKYLGTYILGQIIIWITISTIQFVKFTQVEILFVIIPTLLLKSRSYFC